MHDRNYYSSPKKHTKKEAVLTIVSPNTTVHHSLFLAVIQNFVIALKFVKQEI